MQTGHYFLILVMLTICMLGAMSFVSVCSMLALWDGSALSATVNVFLSLFVLIVVNTPIALLWSLLFVRVTARWEGQE